ncbi:MAG: division/cell wall cluster transcriptional repressor MraZ [Clostridiales bacterium]|jgi:MraZ protein|nr:division/cell wall cluster transcriptional repressor MraZ [Clostridiales bacterium]
MCSIVAEKASKKSDFPQKGEWRAAKMSFYGDFQHNIDQKKRLFIPAQFRDDLGESFMLCKSPDTYKCIYAYTNERWEEICEELHNLPPSEAARQQQRFALVGAMRVEPDKQGRITIGQKLCDYAGLEREVVIFGSGHRIEIWDAAKWEQALADAEKACDNADTAVGIHY